MRSPCSRTLFDEYKAQFNLKNCVVLLGDLNSVDMTKYTLVKKKVNPITVGLDHTNIIDCPKYKHKCEICDSHFKNYSTLDKHRRGHKEWKPLPSGSNRDEPDALAIHHTNIIHGTRNKYKCYTCNLRFKDYSLLEKHRKEHNSRKKSPSDSSSSATDQNDESYSEEEEQNIRSDSKYQCKFCKRIFKYNHTYLNHLKLHNCFVCSKCLKFQESKEALEKHLQVEHNIFSCKLCPQMFFSEKNLETHCKEKHYINGIKCMVCSEKFDTITEMELHIKTNPTWANIVCDLCTKMFHTEAAFEKHLPTHPSFVKILPKRNEPAVITVAAQSKISLKNIQATCEHKCTLCNRIFLTKEHLDVHLAKYIHIHDDVVGTQPQSASHLTTPVTLNQNNQPVLTATNVSKASMTVSNVTTPIKKNVSGFPLIPNKQIFISKSAANPIVSNISSNSISLNPNQDKMLLINDKKYIIVSESDPLSGNGVLKLVVADPSSIQQINTMQPISSVQPINSFLQPTINQTIVLPSTQTNSQINITNKTYNAGDLKPDTTTNIVYTTPGGEGSAPMKVMKTYIGKNRKIVSKVLKKSVALPMERTLQYIGTTVPAKPSTETITSTGMRLESIQQSSPIVTMNPVESNPTVSLMSEMREVLPSEIRNTGDANYFQPKIFLKPLSQLLQNPDIPKEKEPVDEDSDMEPLSPDEDSPEKQEYNFIHSYAKTKKVYRCKECQVVCKRQGKLLQHQNRYKCKICDFGYCKFKMLDIHYSEKHDYKDRCVFCHTQFLTSSQLQQHKKIVHDCKKCNQCYFDLNMHKNNYKCTHCDFYSCGDLCLDKHYKLVHRISTRCAPCNKIFNSNDTFQQHKRDVHFCDKCCTLKMDLNVHKSFCKGAPKVNTNQHVDKSLGVIELDSE